MQRPSRAQVLTAASFTDAAMIAVGVVLLINSALYAEATALIAAGIAAGIPQWVAAERRIRKLKRERALLLRMKAEMDDIAEQSFKP